MKSKAKKINLIRELSEPKGELTQEEKEFISSHSYKDNIIVRNPTDEQRKMVNEICDKGHEIFIINRNIITKNLTSSVAPQRTTAILPQP